MDNYEKLRQILHKHPVGAPKAKAFDEIMRLLFTPEEVEVALGMGFAPRSVARIAGLTGVSEDDVRERCESMANKGIVFSREKRGEMGYALLPTVPGLFEFPFMKGGGTPMHDRLGKLWEEYHHEALGNEFAASETPFSRIIPVEQAISAQVEVLPYEELSKMVEGVKTFALTQCACRVSVAACDKARDVCLIFDSMGEFLIERGFAQRITKEKAKEALLRSEELGLVHTTNNSQDRLNFVCNCCPCCCTVLRGLTQLKNPNAFAKSRWQAQVDPDECVGCGVCEEERCPVEAVKVVDDVANVDPQRCIGCGVCVTACPSEAITLTPRTTPMPEAPSTVVGMALKVATEKGKLDDFMPLMKR
jgi:formate hydrogenlyase subunit 6/NADH:ubiquinone oxidoreductase subunit I